ncbi:MAG: radical SAM protein [Candidatus Falkowbacteria bacterium]
MISTFWLALNYSCNNRCVYCYAEPMKFNSKVNMPLSYAFDVVRTMSLKQVKHCLLIGGEPTLYPSLIELIRFIKKNSEIQIALVTNGRKLSLEDYVKKLIRAGLDRVVISIEGSSEPIHNGIAQTKSYHQTIKGIENCLNNNLPTTTITTINTLNLDDIFDVAKVMQKIGVKDIAYNCATPLVSKEKISNTFVPHPAETAKRVEEIFYSCKDLGLRFNFNATIPICLFSQSALDEMMNSDSIAVGCQMYHGKGAVFDCFGKILPCTHFADIPLFTETISDDSRFVYRNNFFELWENGEIPNQFREALWSYPSEKCKECKYWGGCIGGCPLLWSVYNPKLVIQ